MPSLSIRLRALRPLALPLTIIFIGVVLLSLGVAYLFVHLYRTVEGLPAFVGWLTLQFLPREWRGTLLTGLGLALVSVGLWRLSAIAIIPVRRSGADEGDDELILGYRRAAPPKLAVLSGGPGMLVLSALGPQVQRMTCIVPVQDPVEYYYRASGLFNMQHVYYVVPTPEPIHVLAELDDGTLLDVRHLSLDPAIATNHVIGLQLVRDQQGPPLSLTRLAAEAVAEADAIILGPGSLFESIVPNLMIKELREAIANSPARKIYICNLMTEPGRTTGFSVADHIRVIKQFGGFTPDYVLVNAQRIEAEIYELYAAANQSPVFLSPEEYEERAMLPTDHGGVRGVMLEGSLVIEADLASSVIQYSASLSNPTASRAARVLRHDSQKLGMAIMALLQQG